MWLVSVYGFEIGEDSLDVSGMQDAGGAIVNTRDITVTDTNGNGLFDDDEYLPLEGTMLASFNTEYFNLF